MRFVVVWGVRKRRRLIARESAHHVRPPPDSRGNDIPKMMALSNQFGKYNDIIPRTRANFVGEILKFEKKKAGKGKDLNVPINNQRKLCNHFFSPLWLLYRDRLGPGSVSCVCTIFFVAWRCLLFLPDFSSFSHKV